MKKSSIHYQTAICCVFLTFGLALLAASFLVPPTGVIDPSVLAAFGEILTFAGAIIGIDTKYRQKDNESCGQ